jgi:threonine dehydratase
VQLWLKDETAQPIRAFKIRGAWNRMSAIPAAERARGVSVTDADVRGAQQLLRERAGIIAEPSGAAGLAAVLAGCVPADGLTAIVLTGGNG